MEGPRGYRRLQRETHEDGIPARRAEHDVSTKHGVLWTLMSYQNLEEVEGVGKTITIRDKHTGFTVQVGLDADSGLRFGRIVLSELPIGSLLISNSQGGVEEREGPFYAVRSSW